jgi:hypothetical protein
MIRECFKVASGIMFHSEALTTIGLDPVILDKDPHRVRGPALSLVGDRLLLPTEEDKDASAPQSFPELSEEMFERLDALSPIYDQFGEGSFPMRCLWNVMEYLPLHQSYQHYENPARYETRDFHQGRGRVIPTAWSAVQTTRNWKEWAASWVLRGEGYSESKSPSSAVNKKDVDKKDKIKVHRSVRMRMQARPHDKGERYVPKAILGREDISWANCMENDNLFVQWVD